MYKNYRTVDIITNLMVMGINPLDIMVTGVTGAGKSTTLNTIFQKDVAKVGKGVEPETMGLDNYSLNDYFRLWDTPGLGDGIEKDDEHSKKIIELLYKDYQRDSKQYGFIDTVLVIIEGSTRDMGTNYKLLNEVIVPNFQKSRILVAVNKADKAQSGRYWDYENNKPMKKLKDFLEEQVVSIQKRVMEATGVKIIKPIYYSAEYNYNIDKLMDLIIDNMPMSKREIVVS